MIKESLMSIFDRDLKKLKVELEAYANEKDLWKLEKILQIPSLPQASRLWFL